MGFVLSMLSLVLALKGAAARASDQVASTGTEP